ncbi:MAG: hypothetical protein WCC42_02890, partial [Pseudolabrys sp.]
IMLWSMLLPASGVEKEPQSGCSTSGSLRQASIRQTALVRGYTPDSRWLPKLPLQEVLVSAVPNRGTINSPDH